MPANGRSAGPSSRPSSRASASASSASAASARRSPSASRAMGMDVAYTGRKPQDVPYAFVPDLSALAARVGFPGRRVSRAARRRATSSTPRCSRRSAARARSSTSRAARSSTSRRWSRRSQTGTIKGAGLDVFADEPHIPAALLAMDNVVLLPHVGSATRETRQAMGDLCKANLDAWFAGNGRTLTLIPEAARSAGGSARTRSRAARLSRPARAARLRACAARNSTDEQREHDEPERDPFLRPRPLAEHQHAGEHADHRHRQRRQRRHRHRAACARA